MTDRIEEIRARWEDIEDLPWSVGDHPEHRGVSVVDCVGGPVADVGFGEDADFIAHAPEDVAFLIAEVERCEGRAIETEYNHKANIIAERDATIATLDSQVATRDQWLDLREQDMRKQETLHIAFVAMGNAEIARVKDRAEAAEAEVAKLQAVVAAAREAAGKAYVAGGRGDPGAADLRCYVDTRHIVFLREALTALDADTEAGDE